MGISRGVRPQWLLVTSLLLSGYILSSSGTALCDVSCCSVQPTCEDAQILTCNCPNMPRMNLRKGDFPETVQVIKILNTKQVTIYKYAISYLQSLDSITLSGIDKLVIKQDSMASQNKYGVCSVTVKNIRTLQIENKAFSGDWTWQPNGFPGFSFELLVYNASIDVCQDRSFGGNTSYTEFNNVTINNAKSSCFYGLHDSVTFDITSLQVKTFHYQAFSGNMSTVVIKDSSFTTMHTRSIDIRVTTIQIINSHIGELRSQALSVIASDTLLIDTVRVDHIHRNALIGLQMEGIQKVFEPTVDIYKLELINTENGSLTCSECTKVRFTDLKVAGSLPHICPTDKWTQALSSGGIEGQLNPSQFNIFQQLQKISHCDKHGIPLTVESPQCSEWFASGIATGLNASGSVSKGSTIGTQSSRDAGATSSTPSVMSTIPLDAMNLSDTNNASIHTTLDMYNTTFGGDVDDSQPFATMVNASQHGNKTKASLNNIDAMLRPAVTDTFLVDQYHVFLYLMLGGGITLCVVLTVVILRLMIKRYRSWKPANNMQSVLETLVEVPTERTMNSNDDQEGSDGRRVQTANTELSLNRSTSTSVDENIYEQIRDELLLRPIQWNTSDIQSSLLGGQQGQSNQANSENLTESVSAQVQAIHMGDSLFGSASLSLDYHHYETID